LELQNSVAHHCCEGSGKVKDVYFIRTGNGMDEEEEEEVVVDVCCLVEKDEGQVQGPVISTDLGTTNSAVCASEGQA
jgi:hypothetical protein